MKKNNTAMMMNMMAMYMMMCTSFEMKNPM